MDLEQLSDLYLRRREERAANIERFYHGEKRFLILQRPNYHLWGECNSVEGVWQNNLRHMESWLSKVGKRCRNSFRRNPGCRGR